MMWYQFLLKTVGRTELWTYDPCIVVYTLCIAARLITFYV
jgi:hypothetical protein